jgi:predicted GNAT family acetyltransferase
VTDTVPARAGVGGCRQVEAAETRAVGAVLSSDPLVACPAAEKVAGSGVAAGPDGRFLTRGGPERSLLFVGTSILPLRGGAEDLAAFGRAVAELELGPMSVHGRRDLVAGLWSSLGRYWGAPRQYRERQLLMTTRAPVPEGLAHPGVRPATLEEFDLVLPAAAAMYREELDADPYEVGAGVPFRRRVARSLARGRTWVLLDDGAVVFKADVAAVSARVAQLQGVWVRPDRRGDRLGTRGTAAVCAALRSRGLTPSLVVNEANVAAVRAYRRVGLEPVVDYATVLV